MQDTIQSQKRMPVTSLVTSAQSGTAVQLSLSYLIVGLLALFMNWWIAQFHLPQPYSSLLILATVVCAGLLCTLNLQYTLYLLELSLARLAHGQILEHLQPETERKLFNRRWPLGSLFLRLHEASQQMQYYAANERLTIELRGKALQQAGEAAAQAERNRIARELHDSIKQQIFSISISAAAVRALWKDENVGEAEEVVADIQQSAKEAQVEMQALLQQLRPAPLENTSLVDALRVQAQALGFRTGATVQLEIGEMPGNDRLLPGTQEAIFRLVQEAFANIAKHARARSISLSVQSEEQALRIEVRDDGQGFDMAHAPQGMGLKNLRERALELHGKTEINSQPGEGTRISISIPLLQALNNLEAEARQQYLLTRAVELTRRGYQLCNNLAYICMILIGASSFLTIPWPVILLCALCACYGYGSGVYYRLQVVLRSEPQDLTVLSLKQNDYSAKQIFTAMLGFCAWYSVVQLNLLTQNIGWWILFGLLVGLVIFRLVDRRQRYQSSETYYGLLPLAQLGWELERRRQRLDRSLRVWLTAIVAGLLFSHFLFVFPPATPGQWFVYGIFVLSLILVVSLFFERLQCQRWQQTYKQREQQASAQEVEHG